MIKKVPRKPEMTDEYNTATWRAVETKREFARMWWCQCCGANVVLLSSAQSRSVVKDQGQDSADIICHTNADVQHEASVAGRSSESVALRECTNSHPQRRAQLSLGLPSSLNRPTQQRRPIVAFSPCCSPAPSSQYNSLSARLHESQST